MKKTLMGIGLSLSLVVAGCGNDEGSSDSSEETSGATEQASGSGEFDIGTAGSGGALFPMGTKMAQTITNNSDSLSSSAITSGGSIENIRQMISGEQGMAIASSEIAYFAYEGIDQYEGNQVEDLRSLFGSINQWALAITKEDSEINSIEDMAGGRIGVGAPGSGGENTARKILNSYGITYDDISEEYLSDSEMAEGLSDGMIDAFLLTNPLNSATLMDLSNTQDIQVLPVDEPSFYEEYSYFDVMDVPAGTYPGQDEPVPTPTNRIILVTMNDGTLSHDQVYEIMEILWENESSWVDAHAAVQADTSFDNALEGLTIPLHSGAVEYYESKGVDVPEELIPPEYN
ncbi:TAXI family TRAP transporter solute-binding subunit [Geomicrobium sp. JCM 19039]|uniref:TAXI family TRAP transporter solute-binding subunit n=1 Tax=Geomicrobium sp. JCM 19039 TaxID=1460636 RepID=UPI00045F3888|nr:TAXI family TRAP transporter solute-binding subunit [Geomicrobium sp. JCM 19039]GAK12193.1 TRAP transporter solute receptor, TAXI family precursor [Geomicrobium sp. JCM 19039]